MNMLEPRVPCNLTLSEYGWPCPHFISRSTLHGLLLPCNLTLSEYGWPCLHFNSRSTLHGLLQWCGLLVVSLTHVQTYLYMVLSINLSIIVGYLFAFLWSVPFVLQCNSAFRHHPSPQILCSPLLWVAQLFLRSLMLMFMFHHMFYWILLMSLFLPALKNTL